MCTTPLTLTPNVKLLLRVLTRGPIWSLFSDCLLATVMGTEIHYVNRPIRGFACNLSWCVRNGEFEAVSPLV
jgi:hypothetical protein